MILKKIIKKIINFYFHRQELIRVINQIKKIKLKTKKILIIGSSNSSLKLNKGEEIDKFEYIVRFNGAPVNNFEKAVGSKTNMICVNEEIYKKKSKLVDGKFLDKVSSKDIFVVLEQTPTKDLDFYVIKKNNNTILFPNYLNHHLRFFSISKYNLYKKINTFRYGKKMSMGLILINIFVLARFEVYILGFDLKKNTENYTYYYNDKVKNLSKAHHWEKENEILTKLLKNNKIFQL